MIFFYCGNFILLVPLLSMLLRNILAVNLPRRGIKVGLGIIWLLMILALFRFREIVITIPWGSNWLQIPDFFFGVDQVAVNFVTALLTGLLVLLLWNPMPRSQVEHLLILSGIGMLGIMAANVVTLLLVWTLLDVLWLSRKILHSGWQLEKDNEYFPVIMLGVGPLFLLLAAGMVSWEGSGLMLSELPSKAVPFLTAAGFLRLGVFYPMGSTLAGEADPVRWFRRIVPTVVGLVILTRIVELDGFSPGAVFIRPVLAVLTLMLGILWVLGEDQSENRWLWTVGIGLVVLGNVLQAGVGDAPPAAVEAISTWGLGFLLTGSIPFLIRKRTSLSWPLLFGTGLGLVSLPFTPLWSGTSLYHRGDLWGLLGLVGAGLLIGGTWKSLRIRSGDGKRSQAHPLAFLPGLLGVGLLVLTQYGLALSQGLIDHSLSAGIQDWPRLLPGIIAGGVFFSGPALDRLPGVWHKLPTFIRRYLGWIELGLEKVLGFSGLIVNLTGSLLEGRGGLVWSLLTAFFLLSWIITGGFQ